MKQALQKQSGFSIKPTPFAFLKRLIAIEVIFTLLGIFVSAVVDFSPAFESLNLPGYISYNLVLAFFFTTPQILIISFVFLLWHSEAYQVDTEMIVHKFGGLFPGRETALLENIVSVEVEQGRLGNYFNYGSIILTAGNSAGRGRLKNIPNPTHYAAKIEALIEAPKPLPNSARQKPALELIAGGEGQYLEFKSSFAWDYRQQMVNKNLNQAVMKNVVGFMNTTGGAVMIGVDDEGKILGLGPDLQNLRKKNIDGLENTLNGVFNKMIGAEFRQYAAVDFEEIGNETICIIHVRPSPEPVFLNDKNTEKFYIRTGNGSQPLSMKQALKYIQLHFTELDIGY